MLAVPPFSVSNQSTADIVRVDSRYSEFRTPSKHDSRRDYQKQSSALRGIRSPDLANARTEKELEEMQLEDWLNSEFPPLKPRKSYSIAFGLPKHSQMNDAMMTERMLNSQPPPVAAVDSDSLIVSKLPIQFTWHSRVRELKMAENEASD